MSSVNYFRHALPVGEILGDYEVLSVLGAGGFGVTYLVQHRTMGDRFAIKEYFPQSLAERESSGTVVIRTNTFEDTYYKGLHGFLEEARIVRRLRGHPNVVHVNSFFEANNTAYMVMEYYAGQTLTAFRKQAGDAFDEASIRRLLAPVLDALEYVHQREVVHRDLKPDNVFLCEDGRPILLDFGASRFAAAGGTVPMTAVLTPGFAPPEQYISEGSGETILRQGPWTDLYALGAMLHTLASGRAPYDAMSRQMSGGADPQPPAQTRLPDYSAAFCNAVDACLRLDMRQRPQSIAEFRTLWNPGVAAMPPLPAQPAAVAAAPIAPVQPAAARPAVVAVSTAPSRPMAPAVVTRTPSSWPLWAALIVVLGAAAGGLWWYLQPDPISGPGLKPAAVTPANPTLPASDSTVPPPAAASNKATLMVFSDVACQLTVNGSAQGELQPGAPKSIEVIPGDQAVECRPAGDPSSHRQTKPVLASQQAVVEFQLAQEPAAAGGLLADLQIVVLAAPDFQPAVTGNPGAGRTIGKLLASGAALDTETWFADNGLSLAYAPGPTSMAKRPSWTGGFEIPAFVQDEFDGHPLLKVIDSGDAILSLYGADFSSARVLVAQSAADGSGLYALDFTAYAAAPQRIEADRDYVDQQIVWAQQVDHVLYVSHGHSTYAKSSYGRNAYVSALDVRNDFDPLWRSPALVANAGNFLIHGDALISGYGFTDEPDFLYALDLANGQVTDRVAVKSGPDFLVVKNNQLFVRLYDTDQVFELR